MDQLDIREKGGVRNGQQQISERRLFMQLLAFGNSTNSEALARALHSANIESVLYEDVNDPRGVGLLTWNEDPGFFILKLRPLLRKLPFASLSPKLEYSMLGRTYALGHEPNLEDWLMQKPRRAVSNHLWPWAVWYPLRRKGEFSNLSAEEQTPILREHGAIGHAFGTAGYAQDVRLASFGLDKNDNDFVIGLIGSDLYPLSACVQAMRKTTQTSRYIEAMGPFFIGKAVWQNATLPEAT
ncbi:MAG: chlorite dismutase family protein [Acidobacteriota bacterium]|nr:chlorite dismutase family protein [Acidobacteriota bacterium]